MNNTIKKFFELRNEFFTEGDSHSLKILDLLFTDWFNTTNRNCPKERVVAIPYSSDIIKAMYILDFLGYFNYSINDIDPYSMKITLRNKL